MAKVFHFVVAGRFDDNGKPHFTTDDELFLARFPEGGVFDEESQSWMPRKDMDIVADYELFEALVAKLGGSDNG